MKKNICSSVDKTIRIVAGLAILGAGWYYQNWWGVVGIVPLLTVAFSTCPLYTLFGMDTCHVRSHSH